MSILIVDDNMFVREMLKDLLEHNGYTVALADGGVSALQKIKETKPQLVVLDLMMPDMDGFTVFEQMKRDDEMRNVPVIVLTALEEADLKPEKRSLLLGIRKFITKGTPAFKPNAFLEDVRRIVSSENGDKTLVV